MFAGEVIVVVIILIAIRRIAESPPPAKRPRIDVVGAVLSASGMALFVLGILKAGEWGLVQPKADAPTLAGTSPVIWLISGGLLLLWTFLLWCHRLEQNGGEPLLAPSILRVRQLTGGLTLFGFQFFLQSGIFFTIPLFLSVVLELSAIDTGIRLVPLSISLLVMAVGIPKVRPDADPRRVARVGLLLIVAGTAVFVAGLSPGATAAIVTVPLLLIGAGIGALASQLGAVTVSSLPDDRAPEVGGIQNTATNLGASLGTALIGSILMAGLASSVVSGILANPDIPDSVKTTASVELESGVPFVSDTQLRASLAAAGVPPETADTAVAINAQARLDGLRIALSGVVIFGIVALFFTGRIPRVQPGHADPEAEPDPEPGDDPKRVPVPAAG